MKYLTLVTMGRRTRARQSHDARDHAINRIAKAIHAEGWGLSDAREQPTWATLPGTYFWIGGAFTGHLTDLRLGWERLDVCNRAFEERHGVPVAVLRGGSGNAVVAPLRGKYRTIFRQHFPDQPAAQMWRAMQVPLVERDRERAMGYYDDAEIVDDFLYDALFTRLDTRSVNEPPAWHDLDGTPLSREAFVDKKWVLVVTVADW